MQAEPVWVFGYGSLVWKTNFPFNERVVGYVKGYARRFWQGSIDHRGAPGRPGRVVTLIESPEDCTWGVAYKVLPQDVPDVMMYLDRREVGGYCTERIKFYPHTDTAQPFDVLAYIANGHNPNYLGPAPLDHIAEQIVRSRGPSGENTEYVLELAQAMRTLAPHVVDEHLFALERKVLELLAVPHPAPSPVDPCKGSDDGVCGQTLPCTKPLGNIPVNQGNGTLPDNQGNGLLPDNGPYQITKELEATLTEKFK